MGFAVVDTLATVHACRALEMALRQISKRVGSQLIHHNDCGIQYCRQEYLNTLVPFHIQVSTTENSDPLEATNLLVAGGGAAPVTSPCQLGAVGEKREKLLQPLHAGEHRMSRL